MDNVGYFGCNHIICDDMTRSSVTWNLFIIPKTNQNYNRFKQCIKPWTHQNTTYLTSQKCYQIFSLSILSNNIRNPVFQSSSVDQNA